MTTSGAPSSERVLAVVVDRGHARFFEVTTAGTTELPSFRSTAMRGGRFHSDRQGGPGWGEREYHGRLREEERRHVEGVVERLVTLDRDRPAEGILLAGPGPATAALAQALPPSLTHRLIGTTHLVPREATLAVVERAARSAGASHRQATEQELVATMETGLGQGRATNGARETVRALAQGQVRTLLVASNVQGSGFRCATSGRLVLSAADCLGEGEAVPVPDLMGEAKADARRQGAVVKVIEDTELAKRVDGLAALLRYAS